MTKHKLFVNGMIIDPNAKYKSRNFQLEWEIHKPKMEKQMNLIERIEALENRIRLFGSGANLIGSATTFAGQNQQQRRSFNQQDFENQIALEKANAKGGFAGGLKGAIGGGIAGFALGGPIGAAAGAVGGGLIGGFGGEGTGSSILNASTSLASGGFGKLGKTSGSPSGRVGAPRSAASNDPFSEFNFDSIPRELLRF